MIKEDAKLLRKHEDYYIHIPIWLPVCLTLLIFVFADLYWFGGIIANGTSQLIYGTPVMGISDIKSSHICSNVESQGLFFGGIQGCYKAGEPQVITQGTPYEVNYLTKLFVGIVGSSILIVGTKGLWEWIQRNREVV
jgi:hypothetical protein